MSPFKYLAIFRWFIVTCCVYITVAKEKIPKNLDKCFCMLKGKVDDCTCNIESLDSLNNIQIVPIIESLMSKDYFRYFQVNLNKDCPFWKDQSRCGLTDCTIEPCKPEEVPASLRHHKYTETTNGGDAGCTEQQELSALDTTISEASKAAFRSWSIHDDAQMMFCEIDDEDSEGMEYVDLQLNSERYTGYRGSSAHRVWSSIYDENCFKPEKSKKFSHAYSKESTKSRMCIEKRAFYRLISGLHTSINIHLSAKYLLRASNGLTPAKWGHNVTEFMGKFDPDRTHGEGPQWLKNLYFTYLLEMRAILKAAPYLLKENFYTGNLEDEKELKILIEELVKVIKSFPDHFDESKLFLGDKKEATKLKAAFKRHFHNISRIMDCVGCERCRLWGKIQVIGAGTALKILFSGDQVGPTSTVNAQHKDTFQLQRTEIVALINSFARLASSIKELDTFRRMFKKTH